MKKIKEDEKKIVNEAPEEIFITREPVEAPIESREVVEKKEEPPKKETESLREKIGKMDLYESSKQQVKAQAEQIKLLQDEEKIKKLLEIATKKGVVYTINVAQKMNDPYILDKLHDTLANEGYYKKFLKEK